MTRNGPAFGTRLLPALAIGVLAWRAYGLLGVVIAAVVICGAGIVLTVAAREAAPVAAEGDSDA